MPNTTLGVSDFNHIKGRYMVDIDGSGASEHAVHHFHGLILDAYRQAIETAA